MKKRVISLLLALALCLTILPAMALADDGSAPVGAVARIGANTYASLAAAVKAAAAGAKIELTDDDASEQKITIDKNLTIELNGHNLSSTCFTITHGTVSIRNSAADGGEINKDSEIVADKVSDSVSTSYSLINDIRATISVFGDAQVTLHNLNVGSSGAVVEANPKLKPVYIGGSGAKLTINGGSYVGKKTEGTDGIFFYNGGDSELTINAGYFEGNCGLSVYPKPDTSKLHIVGGRFVGKASVTTISGNATITGNKIYIDEDTLIDCNVRTASPIAEITDGFTGSIGVTAYVWPEAGVEREVVSKANSATGVTSDRDDYEVLCKDGKLYVVKKDSPKEDQDKLEVVLPEGGDKLAYDETLKLDTVGGSGTGDVSWKVVGGTGEATIDENGVLTPVKAGTVIIKAVREGDENYNEAESETVTITIVKGKLTGAPSYTPITADGKTLKDAALEPNASWPAGTLTWVDAEGNELDGTTVVEANATYRWKFTPDNKNYESLTGSYTLYEKSGGDDDDGPHKPSYPVINPTRPSTSNGSQTTTEPESPFRDVSKSDYSYKAITWAAENSIAGGIGNGLFDPNGPCTRAQIVTFLWRAAGSPAPKALSGFVDVPADAYYAKAVAWAVENGITKGTSATTFSPDDICTRAQAVTFLFRAFKAKANGVSTVFRDVAPTAYYAGAVKWTVDNEVTDGIGNGLFGPDNACTRAQIVTFLWRLYAD